MKLNRIVLFLIITIFISCANEKEGYKNDNNRTDSINNNQIVYIDLLNLKMQLDTIHTKDSVLLDLLELKKKTIDTLIQKALKYKDNILEIQIIKSRTIQLNTENKSFFKRIDLLNKENKRLKEENISTAIQLQTQKKDNQKIKTEKNTLEKVISEATKLSIAAIKIMAIGYTKSFFGKPKSFETNQADKTNQVNVSFVITENKLAPKGTKIVATLLYGTPKDEHLSERIEINYNGQEIPVTMIIGKQVEYKAGAHPIEIYIDDYNVYTGNLELK